MFDPIASSTKRKPAPRWFYLASSERAPTGSYGAATLQSFMSRNVASQCATMGCVRAFDMVPVFKLFVAKSGENTSGRSLAGNTRKIGCTFVASAYIKGMTSYV